MIQRQHHPTEKLNTEGIFGGSKQKGNINFKYDHIANLMLLSEIFFFFFLQRLDCLPMLFLFSQQVNGTVRSTKGENKSFLLENLWSVSQALFSKLSHSSQAFGALRSHPCDPSSFVFHSTLFSYGLSPKENLQSQIPTPCRAPAQPNYQNQITSQPLGILWFPL